MIAVNFGHNIQDFRVKDIPDMCSILQQLEKIESHFLNDPYLEQAIASTKRFMDEKLKSVPPKAFSYLNHDAEEAQVSLSLSLSPLSLSLCMCV